MPKDPFEPKNPEVAANDSSAELSFDQAEEEYVALSPGRLIWRKFAKNRLAVVSGILLIILYLSVFMAEFVSPYGLRTRHRGFEHAPPQRVRFIDVDGNFGLRPFVYPQEQTLDRATRSRYYTTDTSEKQYIQFFVRGEPYRLFGFINWDVHLFGVEEGPIFLFGSDQQGRDLFSRILFGGRISLTVGLIGVVISMILGSVLGVISGFFGGTLDLIIQRVIELLMGFPRIPLWMAFAAALPPQWSSITVYFGITVVLSLIGWGGLARQIRGMTLSLREKEFIDASRTVGGSTWWIMIKHLIPNNFSHIIVISTLAIPEMILGETSLSFLGLGIRPPMTSWGTLLEGAQSIYVLSNYPWLIIPVFFVIGVVLCFNFLGDGLRDAADPYSN